MIVIGISGKKGSGKTTVSSAIKEFFPSNKYEIVELKFAGVLYEIHDTMRNIMQSYGVDVKGSKDRVLLQWIGTEWGRESFYQNVWIDIITKKIQNLEKKGKKEKVYVIDDLRFPNELKLLQEMGAVTVRLECPAEVRSRRAESYQGIVSKPEGLLQNILFFLTGGNYPKVKEHISETALDHAVDQFDFTIDTNRLGIEEVVDTVKGNLDLLETSKTLRNGNLKIVPSADSVESSRLDKVDGYEHH